MERSKNFHIWLGISALLIAGSAGFFSVFGLSKLFAGAAFSVIIMAGSLEFGKLVTAAFLYRYWDKVNLFQKTYLVNNFNLKIKEMNFSFIAADLFAWTLKD